MLLETDPDFLDYNSLYIFSPSLYQDEYQLLIHGFKNKLKKEHIIQLINKQFILGESDPKFLSEQFSEILEDDEKWLDIEIHFYENGKDVPKPEDINNNRNKKPFFIFDDCMLGPQSNIEEYFTRGRHSNINCLYISQSYYKLPKKSIRDNANFLMLFQLNKRDLQNIHNDLCSQDIEQYDTFKRFANKVWDQKYNFMVIDRFNEDKNWRYRKGFDKPFNEIMGYDLSIINE